MNTIFHVQFPGLGLEFTIDRVALSLGGFNIYWYGTVIALGLLLGMVWAFRCAPDYGIDGDRLVDVVMIGTVFGIVCARICYIAMAPFEYQSIWEMFDLRLGGLAIYGGIIGAFVFGGIAAKWRKIPLLPLFDVVGMGFLIGQGIGRWGNFFNQEAFGTNTALPWGMYSEGTASYLTGVQATLAAQGVTVDPSLPVHPTFLYESIWCLAGFVFLALTHKRRKFAGQIFLEYIIWYGLGRYWIEGLRTDSLLVGNTDLRFSQMVALFSVAFSITMLVYGLRKSRGKSLQVTLAVSDLKKQREGSADTPVYHQVRAGEGVNFVIPQKVAAGEAQQDMAFYLRVKQPDQNMVLSCRMGEETVSSKKERFVAPPEMLVARVKSGCPLTQELTVEVRKEKRDGQ